MEDATNNGGSDVEARLAAALAGELELTEPELERLLTELGMQRAEFDDLAALSSALEFGAVMRMADTEPAPHVDVHGILERESRAAAAPLHPPRPAWGRRVAAAVALAAAAGLLFLWIPRDDPAPSPAGPGPREYLGAGTIESAWFEERAGRIVLEGRVPRFDSVAVTLQASENGRTWTDIDEVTELAAQWNLDAEARSALAGLDEDVVLRIWIEAGGAAPQSFGLPLSRR